MEDLAVAFVDASKILALFLEAKQKQNVVIGSRKAYATGLVSDPLAPRRGEQIVAGDGHWADGS